MRVPLACAAALVALSLVPAASSQTNSDDDGCLSRSPCPLVIELVPEGFWFIHDIACDHDNGTLECERHGEPVTALEVTLGDWYTLHIELTDLENDTTPTHTVTLEGHENAQASVRNEDIGRSQAFQFDRLGTFTLREEPSGDEFDIRVGEEDVSAPSGTDDGRETASSEGSPGLGLAAMAVAVVAVALVLRRR